jgi:hypothetical protein
MNLSTVTAANRITNNPAEAMHQLCLDAAAARFQICAQRNYKQTAAAASTVIIIIIIVITNSIKIVPSIN